MTVRLETQGHIARILIDRAEKRNAFSHSMWEAFPALVEEANRQDAVKVIILQSATAGVFCAGADIGEFTTSVHDISWRESNQAAINKTQKVLARSEKPVLAAIDGDCVGGGCGLAIACDLRFAAPHARLGITPAKLGLVYPLHDTKLLVDVVGPSQAKRILFTAQLLSAAEALRIGLVDFVEENPLQAAEAMADAIASVSSHSVREAKKMVRRIVEGQSHDDKETEALFADAFLGPDFKEGSSAFLERRKAAFK